MWSSQPALNVDVQAEIIKPQLTGLNPCKTTSRQAAVLTEKACIKLKVPWNEKIPRWFPVTLTVLLYTSRLYVQKCTFTHFYFRILHFSFEMSNPLLNSSWCSGSGCNKVRVDGKVMWSSAATHQHSVDFPLKATLQMTFLTFSATKCLLNFACRNYNNIKLLYHYVSHIVVFEYRKRSKWFQRSL